MAKITDKLAGVISRIKEEGFADMKCHDKIKKLVEVGSGGFNEELGNWILKNHQGIFRFIDNTRPRNIILSIMREPHLNNLRRMKKLGLNSQTYYKWINALRGIGILEKQEKAPEVFEKFNRRMETIMEAALMSRAVVIEKKVPHNG